MSVVLITGCSSGFGLQAALAFARAGDTVYASMRNVDKAERLRAATTPDLDIRIVELDVRKPAMFAPLIASIVSRSRRLDVLVNNAGMTRRGAFHEQPAADWQAILRLNVDSLFVVGQIVARRMVARGAGRIINTCSVMSELGRPGTAAYTASKGAVKMLTKGMAIDLGPLGVNVNGIGPGYFRTELTASLAADETFTRWLVGRTPSRRWGDVEDLAPAAVFLASDASRFVNGHILYVDGGVTATL